MQWDYEGLKQRAGELCVRVKDLLVLSHHNDPFYIFSSRRAEAEWFAKMWEKMEMQPGDHNRGLHYKLVSQKKPVLMQDRMRYTNTVECWFRLVRASRDARYLGLVDAADMADRRNAEPVIYHREGDGGGVPSYHVSSSEIDWQVQMPTLPSLPSMPVLPFAWLNVETREQPYRLEIWCEKSTMDHVLDPLAAQYGATLIIGTGEISATHCHLAVGRAEEDVRSSDDDADGEVSSGDLRPVRILYISDFDPAGLSMPVSAARKIEFYARQQPGLDIQLIPIGLNHDQCVEYELPRTPIKKSEMRKAKFEERYGTGATELDALEALHPGVLRRIVKEAILRFYDADLDRRTREMAAEVREQLHDATNEVHHEHYKQIETLQAQYAELSAQYDEMISTCRERLVEIEARLADWKEEAEELWGTLTDEIENLVDPYMDGVEWPEPREADDLLDDALYDSARSYTDQLRYYKAFQGKGEEDDDDEG
jgi:hypothetical protein